VRSSPSNLVQLRSQPALTDHDSRVTSHVSRFSHALNRIQDWPGLAHDAKYSVKALAAYCGVSVRVLERFFQSSIGCKPSHWLKNLRMQRAVELLRDGSNVNETADRLGYLDRSHFSREFKRFYGRSPKYHESWPSQLRPQPKLSHSATKLSHLATYQ
jgi:AraC-like DNA-binding protein